ncbi:MAG TPA: hypothetical protein VHP99_04145 [Pyrinomonadaceae bacterium]|jgi:hypothetical protein|nr:hypothetical protein [Pyrinomonadaceae bacterium]
MKLGVLLIAGLLVVFGAGRSPLAQSGDDKAHQRWLEDRYKEAASIQPGMTRADLMKLFIEDGGIQMIPARRYVLKSCYLIQIEVKLEGPSQGDYRSVPDNELKIVEVSKPYLQHMAQD